MNCDCSSKDPVPGGGKHLEPSQTSADTFSLCLLCISCATFGLLLTLPHGTVGGFVVCVGGGGWGGGGGGEGGGGGGGGGGLHAGRT